jgi:hypothetical protein
VIFAYLARETAVAAFLVDTTGCCITVANVGAIAAAVTTVVATSTEAMVVTGTTVVAGVTVVVVTAVVVVTTVVVVTAVVGVTVVVGASVVGTTVVEEFAAHIAYSVKFAVRP